MDEQVPAMMDEGTASLTINLHPAQALIFNSPARFKVVAAGRRFGKSWLACYLLLYKALQDIHVGLSGTEYDLSLKEVWYVAPTFLQGKNIMWQMLKKLGQDVIAHTHENTATCTLVNGRRICIKGADDPDSLRGAGLSFVALDEYAFMKPSVWEQIIRPALGDVEGEALFIGTPDFENHFYELFCDAYRLGLPEWQAWQFKSVDNPTLNSQEIARAKEQLSSQIFAQEYEASFASESGTIFNAKWWIKSTSEPRQGEYYIACDLAGFSNVGTLKRKELKLRDESVIAVVKVNREGWYVKDLIHGQWDVRETALRVMKAYKDYRPVALGIEQGITKNAVFPYLEDEMKRLDVYFPVHELKHGNTKKVERIRWALQGRAEKGRITLNDAEWTPQFIKQAASFPSPLAHDDMLDAVSYVDQLASVVYFDVIADAGVEVYDDTIGW
jgi:predicted phage terminase large subunit-like protein